MINQIMETQNREGEKITKAVIGIMGNMNPHLRDVPDFQHKLWDQSHNVQRLDVDSSYEPKRGFRTETILNIPTKKPQISILW